MKKFFYLFISILIFIGCSKIINKYRVRVDALAISNRVAPSTFFIKPLDPKIDMLKFRRHSRRLADILVKKGFIESKTEKFAEQLIYFGYGIKKVDERSVTYQEPDVSVGMSVGTPIYRHSRFHSRMFWNDVDYTRYKTYTKIYRIYSRYIKVIAKDKNGTELWRVDANSIGESDNIEAIVPILLKAITNYIGKNLDKPIEVDVDENLTKK
jgi:hypothetical protein